ncbi:uncharacterized protein NPIL_273781 [Nephila pilipes]|uniref:Gustatory receptor n=1 Tax=Nephila pilipes TaxID=299642 RepID=A0A8X6QBW3_NEPPI|nr:uncharacterized protein NPIL_273781 [Nephila pilipes]
MIASVWNRDKTRSSKLCCKSKDLRSSSSYGMILRVLSCTGINLFEEQAKKSRDFAFRIFGMCFTLFLHLSSIDYWIMSYFNLKSNWHEYQVVLSLVFSNNASLLLWHVLYRKRRYLRILLEKMEAICDSHLVVSLFEKTLINCIILFGIFIVPLTYSSISVYLMNQNDTSDYYSFFTYGRKVSNFTTCLNAYLFTKSLMTSLLEPIFTSCVTFIYCLLCYRSCRLLVEFRKRIVNLLSSGSKPSREVLKQLIVDYGRLCRVLERLQCVFSLPSFLLTIVDVMSSFTILASSLLYTPEEITGPMIAENAFTLMTSAMLIIALIAFAAQIPVTMSTIRMCLQKIQEKRVVTECQGTLEDSRFRLLQILKERPLVILSGCDIIYFTRITIVTVLGTLLTYGLLIIQLK